MIWQNHQLYLRKGVSLCSLAVEYGTPLYVYDLQKIERNLQLYREAFRGKAELYYAMKANSHPQILKLVAQMGEGVDVVSGGEMEMAYQAGVPPDKIIFSGVGKTVSELELALCKGVGQINVESVPELERIASVAIRLKVQACVAFRINPDVQPNTHPYIATGFRENKFGMNEGDLPHAQELLQKHPKALRLQGLTMHVGSQILDTSVILEAIEKAIPIYKQFSGLSTFDIGGGVGISYADSQQAPDISSFGEQVCQLLEPLSCRVLVEPGRVIVGPAGVLLTEVQYVKETPFKCFVIVDTGMHHLLRPALYGASHRITPIVKPLTKNKSVVCDIVGPICESADVLGKSRILTFPQQGDVLSIHDVGAYGAVMSSRYNAHSPVKELAL